MNKTQENTSTIRGFSYLSFMMPIFDIKGGNFGHEIIKHDLESRTVFFSVIYDSDFGDEK